MPDLLLEVGTGEMPIDVLSALASDLSRRAGEAISENGLLGDGIRVLYTLRRLVFIMRNVTGQRLGGEEVINTISRVLGGIMAALTSERAIRRDASPADFILPIRYLVCLYGEQVIPVRARNVTADRVTRGHWRTHREESIALPSPAGYEQALAGGGVVVDPERRKQMVSNAVTAAAHEENVSAQIDDDLLVKIADAVEYPQPVIGRVNLPSDLRVTFANAALREAGFVPLDAGQGSDIRFVGFADGAMEQDVVRVGYERVARSALRGCKLLFSRDRKASLADHVRSLRGIDGELGLGSLWEKTERLRTLAGQIAQAIDASPGTVDRAAFLSQADRATWIVRAFPSLHGIAGATYAVLDGEESSVCIALEEGALSISNGIPGASEGLAIAIARSYDDLCSRLLTGSDMHDPQVIGVVDDLIALMVGGKVDLDLLSLLAPVSEQFNIFAPVMKTEELGKRLRTCLEERLVEYIETSEKITSPIASAIPQEVRANPYRSSACARALHEASGGEDFSLLLGSFERLRALLPAGSTRAFDPALFEGESERALWRAYLKAEGKLEAFLTKLDYAQAIDQLITLGSAIDRYTKDIDTHAGPKSMGNNRLGLIASVLDQFAHVCDLAALLAAHGYALSDEKR